MEIICRECLAATATFIVAAAAVVMIATAVIMIAATGIATCIAARYLILWPSNDKALLLTIIHKINDRLSEKLSIIRIHVNLYAPALEDDIVVFRIAKSQAIGCTGSINSCQEHADYFAFYEAFVNYLGCCASDLNHE